MPFIYNKDSRILFPQTTLIKMTQYLQKKNPTSISSQEKSDQPKVKKAIISSAQTPCLDQEYNSKINHKSLNSTLVCDKMWNKWIFDSGATDTVTYNQNDFQNRISTSKTHIQTATGEYVDVEKLEQLK